MIDPKAGGPEVQAELQAIHDGPSTGESVLSANFGKPGYPGGIDPVTGKIIRC